MKKKKNTSLYLLLFVIAGTVTCLPAGILGDDINWKAFMARHDLLWDVLPKRWEDGSFDGNGRFASVLYQNSEKSLRWQLGHTGITTRSGGNSQLPVGSLLLETVGTIQSGTMRLDLWNAETLTHVKTDKGALEIRSLIHAVDRVQVIVVNATGEETGAMIGLEGAKGGGRMDGLPAFQEESGQVWVTRRGAGGDYARAWNEREISPGKRMLVLSIADSFPGSAYSHEDPSEKVVRERISGALEKSPDKLVAGHRQWWHDYYQQSLVSVPDQRVESFYWIQLYKLACATREDGYPPTTLGPWCVRTAWPRMYNDMNTQTFYAPMFTANKLELAGSLKKFFEANEKHLHRMGEEMFDMPGRAAVLMHCGIEGPWDSSHSKQKMVTRGKHYNSSELIWLLHSYWKLYRYSMDERVIVDREEFSFFEMLKRAVNVYFDRYLKDKGEDGKYHLKTLHSPEIADVEDANYQIACLSWACRTLVYLCQRDKRTDPLLPKWKDVMENLVEYQVGPQGYLLGKDLPLMKAHRHWHHLQMIYPYYLVDTDDPQERELIRKSLKWWIERPTDRKSFAKYGPGFRAWSAAAAASLYAATGDGDEAVKYLRQHNNSTNNIMPNTMYLEKFPVIESATASSRSLLDMMLLSHNDVIRVFPAIPGEWKDARFRTLRAEGAFLISAVYNEGKTRWVKIKSLAGAPCTVRADFNEQPKAAGSRKFKLTPCGLNTWTIDLKKGEEVVLAAEGERASGVVPVPEDKARCNYFGINRNDKSDAEYEELIKRSATTIHKY